MDTTRRHLLSGAAALTFTAASPGLLRADTPYVLKLGNDVPLTHPINVRLKEAADRIRTETDGRVDVQIFPNNQLGSDTDMLSQVRSGAVELVAMPGTILATLVPAASLNSVGFAFADYPAVWKAMDGDLGRYIRKEVAKSNLVVMDRIWDNGFRQVTTRTKAVTGPQDLVDMKIRVPVSPMLLSIFRSLKAAPTSINLSELYSALQTRIVDGQENALPIISATKLYEVQKYCATTRHAWDGYWMLANRRSWGALPADLGAVVSKNLDRSALDQRADSEALAQSLRATLTGQGMSFNDPDTAPFRDQLTKAGFYTDWRQKFGEDAWAALEAAAGKLG